MLAGYAFLLPDDIIPKAHRMKGLKPVRAVHTTDCGKNMGLFTPGEEFEDRIVIRDHNHMKGVNGEPIGFGLETTVAFEAGAMLPLLCWGPITTEAKFYEEAAAAGKPVEFPALPGVYALQTPYEE